LFIQHIKCKHTVVIATFYKLKSTTQSNTMDEAKEQAHRIKRLHPLGFKNKLSYLFKC